MAKASSGADEAAERAVRPALAASRGVAIMNFLSAHPTDSFSLSDIVRKLGINAASAHAILRVLTDAGYLSRHPRRRTYGLGPALVAVGTSALEQHRSIDAARDEIRLLSDELGLELTVSAAIGEEIILVARAGRYLADSEPVHVGQRIPLVPPLGTVFLAWEEPDVIDAWIGRARGKATPKQTAALEDALAAVRSYGYAVGLQAEANKRLVAAVDQLASAPMDKDLRKRIDSLLDELCQSGYLFREIRASKQYSVSMIAAPVFDGEGRVTTALTLMGLPQSLPGQQVIAYAERVRSSASVITQRIRGRMPR